MSTTPEFHALYTVHTPSGQTNACEKHARNVIAVCRFMGWHANTTQPPEGAQCDNCVNEAKAKKGQP